MSAENSGRNWDRHLQLYPTYCLRSVLCQSVSPYVVDSDDYRHELTNSLNTAWNLAKEYIKGAQDRQKRSYDKDAKDHQFRVGDRVMIHMPSVVSGKAWKLARPYHGPYRVLSVTIEARLVDDANADPIFVAVNRVRPCAADLPNTPWTGTTKRRRRRKRIAKSDENKDVSPRRTGPVTRSMTRDSV